MKALERDPNDRYQDAWTFAQDLEVVLHQVSPGYSSLRLSRFMEQYFAEEKPKTLNELLVEAGMTPAGISGAAPAVNYSLPPNHTPATPAQSTPAGGTPHPAQAHAQAHQPEPVHVGQGGVSIAGRHVTPAVEARHNDTDAHPMPTPEQLGFQKMGDTGEMDATLSMSAADDPGISALLEEDQEEPTINMGISADVVAQATEQVESKAAVARRRAKERKKKSKFGLGAKLFLVFGILFFFLMGGGIVAFIVYVEQSEEQEVEKEPEPELEPEPEPEPEPPKTDEAVKGATEIFNKALVASSADTSKDVPITIGSTPEGAEVLQGDKNLGKTPLTIQLPRHKSKRHRFTLRLDGHRDKVANIVAASPSTETIELVPKPGEKAPAPKKAAPAKAAPPAKAPEAKPSKPAPVKEAPAKKAPPAKKPAAKKKDGGSGLMDPW